MFTYLNFLFCAFSAFISLSSVLQIMPDNDIPSESIHYFHIASEIPDVVSVEIEGQQIDLHDTVSIK